MGSVNLKHFAFTDVNGTSGTGLQVDDRYPSYILVPQMRYCGVNDIDHFQTPGS